MSISSSALNVLFLGAGYGTRLARDILADPSQSYLHLNGIAKALLPVRGIPLINYWIKMLKSVIREESENMYIVCNDYNHDQFVRWANEYMFPISHILNDGSKTNEARLGAVRDMELAVSHFGLQEKPLLVIAGDTLFLSDFQIQSFLELATSQASLQSIVTSYTVAKDMDTLKTGILVLNRDSPSLSSTSLIQDLPLCTGFLEKPHPNDTPSRVACPCFYFLIPSDLKRLSVFLQQRKQEGVPLAETDATGKFIGWLICEAKAELLAYPISGRLDIGGLESFIEAEEYLKGTSI